MAKPPWWGPPEAGSWSRHISLGQRFAGRRPGAGLAGRRRNGPGRRCYGLLITGGPSPGTAADYLAAGRDLVQTHFTEGPFGGREDNSYWAPLVTSGPVTEGQPW